jgi:hypothetical protein
MTIALDYAHDDSLVRPVFPARFCLLTATDLCFINLNVAAQLAANVRTRHKLSEFTANPPSTFIGYARLALNLLRRHAMSCTSH